MKVHFALALLLLLPACEIPQSYDKGSKENVYFGEGSISDELPVTRVALYQNGVGYFERRGTVTGNTLTLRIRPDQINDILKSLTVIDMGEGRPVSISLPVDKQALDELASLPTQIRDEGGILSLLEAFRGARVTVRTGGADVHGRIVGIEDVPVRDRNGVYLSQWRVTLKSEAGTLDIVRVDDIEQLQLDDRTLEVGLDKSLDISLNDGSWKPIELKVRMSGSGTRDILVSYIVSMPIWKPAYRVVLGEDETGLFQGWAVVDNVSGSDWNDVSMALVAGTPMSFVYDLYSPHFVHRPDLSYQMQSVAYAPTIEESGKRGLVETTATADGSLGAYGLAGTGSGGGGYGSGVGGLGQSAPKSATRRAKAAEKNEEKAWGEYELADEEDAYNMPAEPSPIDLAAYEQNFEGSASGTELSALFQYDIQSRVTVPDRSSALVNLLQEKGKAREIALFRTEPYSNYDALHSYRAVEFTNTSGYALEPGPATLYDNGTFIGEGFLGRTEKDAVAYITFALDPNIVLKNSLGDSEEAARIVRIKGGSIESELKRVTTVSYELRNMGNEEVTAVIRRPIRAGWTLDPEPEGTVTASGAYYIPVKLEANKTTEFKLREVTPVTRSLTLDSRLAQEMLLAQLSDASMDAELKQQVQQVVDKQAELNTTREELERLRKEKAELESESWRVAQSLNDLADIKESSAKELRTKLIQRATEIENQIGALTTKLTELGIRERDTEKTLRALFTSITFEAK